MLPGKGLWTDYTVHVHNNYHKTGADSEDSEREASQSLQFWKGEVQKLKVSVLRTTFL